MWQDDSDATNASSGSTASVFEIGGGTTLGELDAGTVTAPSKRHSWPREYLLSVNAALLGRVQITVAVYVLISGFSSVERVKGIEPSSLGWEPRALPLSYTRSRRPILCGQPSAQQRDKLMLMSLLTEAARSRGVRSFVLRAGRVTQAQQRALSLLWPKYGIEFSPQPADLDSIFGRRAPRVLEIGFGNGENLATLAEAHPERDYLGIEVHRPGVGRLLLAADASGLSNVRVICHDAVEVLERQLPSHSLDAVMILFPDPWPKK